MKVYISGASGFVGKPLCRFLEEQKIEIIRGNRESYGDIREVQDWSIFLRGCSSVIHLASKVHDFKNLDDSLEKEYWDVNVNTTFEIAKAAKRVGVKKFIFLSSIKVNGDETFDKPFTENDKPNPHGIYGKTKYEAEKKLSELNEPGRFNVIIIRTPLVYGEGIKANLDFLLKIIKTQLPLPFLLVQNKRSLVSTFNLNDFISKVLMSENKGGVFLVSDGVEYSLKDIVINLARISNKKVLLFPFPITFFSFFFNLINNKDLNAKLFGNLVVDSSLACEEFNWSPKENLFNLPKGRYF